MQANNVDLYINGHDHCLEHISSLDRWTTCPFICLKPRNNKCHACTYAFCIFDIQNLNDVCAYVKCSSVQFLTSGGGSKAWRGDTKQSEGDEMKFYYDGQGFMSVHISQTQLRISFFDVFGNAIHKWNTCKFDSCDM